MKKTIFGLLFLASAGLSAQVVVNVHLDSLNNNRVPVRIKPSKTAETLTYQLPKMVPGTYTVYDFGRFVENFKAIDKGGNALPVERIDSNTWKISNAKNLSHISYLARESFNDHSVGNMLKCGQTEFEQDVFLLNLFNMVGFFNGNTKEAYRLEVSKPAGFYGATALTPLSREGQKDAFTTTDYFTLHDSPILYTKPDTASVQVANCRVEVSVFSPNREVTAKECLKVSKDVLEAAAKYLNGKLPSDYYGILIYLMDPNGDDLDHLGALEHQRSTVLTMPEDASEEALVQIRDIVAHEFLHIVTPLMLHSEYVADFNFMEPKMSKHLWLYEGVTEYTSHLIQVRAGLTTMRQFLTEMRNKMVTADRFSQYIPMTVSSEFNLEYFSDEYLNVYNKGALIGMALDMELRRLSRGDMGLGDLIAKLGATYGPDTFFVDDQLFDIMTAASFPEIREFFARYVEGSEPLPYEALFYDAGIGYTAEENYLRNTFGGFGLNYNPESGRIFVDDVSEANNYGQTLGIVEGDEIISINGMPFGLDTYQTTIDRYRSEIKPGEKVTWVVARPNGKGGYAEKKLKAKMELEEATARHQFQLKSDLNSTQKRFRQSWINTLE